MLRIVTARRISQVFFLLMFLWFCLAATLGEAWWQLRGWPVNWFLELDPLAGLGVLLTTGTVYKGMIWCVATVVLTIALGRFFCGWLCPFGTIHQFLGYLGNRFKSSGARARANRYHTAQAIKYWILTFLLATAAGELLRSILIFPRKGAAAIGLSAALLVALCTWLGAVKKTGQTKNVRGCLLAAAAWAVFYLAYEDGIFPSTSLQIGLLDPIALFQRSVNLVVIPLLDGSALTLPASRRLYDGSLLIAVIFLAAVLLNLRVPRFYCRYVCPLGALFGLLGRYALFRIGKTEAECVNCKLCQGHCEGACNPAGEIRFAECVLCMNCREECSHGLIAYQDSRSAAGEIPGADISRREVVLSLAAGVMAIPMLRLEGHLSSNWDSSLIRPPGALGEEDFLGRCIKCSQCMRVCPTNVIHPASLAQGLEGLWTPQLNFHIGTSGCQFNCIACGNICPTAAIRPLKLDQRLGKNQYASAGPIVIGTAFVDRGRCLPWAMSTPCIVCQENCPVSPKAILTRVSFDPVPTQGKLVVKSADSSEVTFENPAMPANRFGSGDYYCRVVNAQRPLGMPGRQPWPGPGVWPVAENSERMISFGKNVGFAPPPPGSRMEILIRLQRPYVAPTACIGCGVCEHECPVKGKRAIRVTAENESRSKEHQMVLMSR